MFDTPTWVYFLVHNDLLVCSLSTGMSLQVCLGLTHSLHQWIFQLWLWRTVYSMTVEC